LRSQSSSTGDTLKGKEPQPLFVPEDEDEEDTEARDEDVTMVAGEDDLGEGEDDIVLNTAKASWSRPASQVHNRNSPEPQEEEIQAEKPDVDASPGSPFDARALHSSSRKSPPPSKAISSAVITPTSPGIRTIAASSPLNSLLSRRVHTAGPLPKAASAANRQTTTSRPREVQRDLRHMLTARPRQEEKIQAAKTLDDACDEEAGADSDAESSTQRDTTPHRHTVQLIRPTTLSPTKNSEEQEGITGNREDAASAASDEDIDDSDITPIFDPEHDGSSSSLMDSSIEPVSRPEVARTHSDGSDDIVLRFDIKKLKERWKRMRHVGASSKQSPENDAEGRGTPSEAGINNHENDAEAVDALSRVIEKADFGQMDILGQFNLGFIITRRQKKTNLDEGRQLQTGEDMDDLFIVDQHAADEKYNFETLQATTVIKSQRLFKYVTRVLSFIPWLTAGCYRPQVLELTASDEIVAVENLDVLQKNGFEIEVPDLPSNEDELSDAELAIGNGSRTKLKLVAQPTSKNTVFNMKGQLFFLNSLYPSLNADHLHS
jgi:DNA mismatch repair protein PMS2